MAKKRRKSEESAATDTGYTVVTGQDHLSSQQNSLLADKDAPRWSPVVASRLAAELSVSKSSVIKLVEKWAEELRPFVSVDDSADQLDACREFAAEILRDVTRAFGGPDAIKRAAGSDITKLAERYLAAAILFDDGSDGRALLMPKARLASQLAKLQWFLEDNRKSLVETGLPEARFGSNRRLFEWLGCLYPVRYFRPRQYWAPESTEDLALWFEWLRRDRGPIRFAELIEVDYSRAEHFEWLSRTDVARISRVRPRLLELKIKILSALVSALLQPKGPPSWQAPLSRIRIELPREPASFLRRIDGAYGSRSAFRAGQGPLLQALHGDPHPFESGGLTNIIELLWHVECERQFGPMHNLAEALRVAGVLRQGKHGPRLSRDLGNPLSRSTLSPTTRRRIDAALDQFLENEQHCSSLLPAFESATAELNTNEGTPTFGSQIQRQLIQPDLKELIDVYKERAADGTLRQLLGSNADPVAKSQLDAPKDVQSDPRDVFVSEEELEMARKLCDEYPKATKTRFMEQLDVGSNKAQTLMRRMRQEGRLKTRARKPRKKS